MLIPAVIRRNVRRLHRQTDRNFSIKVFYKISVSKIQNFENRRQQYRNSIFLSQLLNRLLSVYLTL